MVRALLKLAVAFTCLQGKEFHVSHIILKWSYAFPEVAPCVCPLGVDSDGTAPEDNFGWQYLLSG